MSADAASPGGAPPSAAHRMLSRAAFLFSQDGDCTALDRAIEAALAVARPVELSDRDLDAWTWEVLHPRLSGMLPSDQFSVSDIEEMARYTARCAVAAALRPPETRSETT